MPELRTKNPLLFGSRSLSAGTVLVVSGFFALFGVMFFTGLYLQNVHDYSPIQTGVRMLPLTASFVISAPLGGLMTERFGPRVPLVLGMLILAGAFVAMAQLGVDSSYNAQWPPFLAIGMAIGLVITASTEAIVGNAPVQAGGVAGGLQTTANQLGGVLGTAVLGSVIASRVGSTLLGELDRAGVPAPVAQGLSGQKELVAQGIAPVGPGMSSQVAAAITGRRSRRSAA